MSDKGMKAQDPIKDIEAQKQTIQERAAAIVVKNDADLVAARDYIKDIKAFVAYVGEKLDANIAKAHDLHKSLVAQKNEYITPARTLQKAIEDKMKDYIVQKELAAKKEQERLNEIARKEAAVAQEKADKKIAALMEKAGSIQEQIDALSEELMKPGVSALETEKIERQIEALHRKLEAATEKAEAVQEQVEQAVAMPIVVQAETKVAGMSVGKRTVIVSVDIKKLAAAVGAGTIPETILSVNEGPMIKLIDAGMADRFTESGVVHDKKVKLGVRS